ncbi:DUF3159 domain-containing protein [Mycetocola spongiae]|uniref:DUF3159 domain-containing protein n=1 Tax=Mycetocola spongiae TaxID=2859226 RepID=UPI001CF1BA41|nr:DUF3159 domain-containing protein [Mycetocola spongiae]UCR89521.1 DUF3159 domain-containing protein [Mycetocola spongiae]
MTDPQTPATPEDKSPTENSSPVHPDAREHLPEVIPEDAAATLGKSLAEAARKSGLGELAAGETLSASSLLSAIGGIRGIFEAIVPGLVFVIVYTTTQSLPWAAGVSVAIALLATVARVIGKTPITAAIGGLVGVVASAALALWTGKPENNFLIGFYINGGYALALIISMLVRWPLIGLVAGFLMGDGTAWRAQRAKRRIMQALTGLWVAMFLARLAVQLPFYLAEDTVWLGITRIAMGLPLYAPILVVTWLIVRSVYRRADTAE